MDRNSCLSKSLNHLCQIVTAALKLTHASLDFMVQADTVETERLAVACDAF